MLEWSRLRCFEAKLDYLTTHNVAQVMLPELSESRHVVYQELEAQIAPERQELQPHLALTVASLRVIAEAGVVLPEIAKREAIQMPAMGRVAERAEIGVMGRGDVHGPAGTKQAVKLFHRA